MKLLTHSFSIYDIELYKIHKAFTNNWYIIFYSTSFKLHYKTPKNSSKYLILKHVKFIMKLLLILIQK